MQIHPKLELAYASTSRDVGNIDAVVTSILSILEHLILTLFDSKSTYYFISVMFTSQVEFKLEPFSHVLHVSIPT